jgi:hypothetical protein
MAAHSEVEYSTAKGNDYAEHEQSYEFFLKLTKWGVISVGIIVFGMFIFLT